MNVNIELEHIFKEAITKGINLFSGSGFSVHAKDGNNRQLPTSDQLKKELITEFSRQDIDSLSIDKISTILKSTRLDDFNRYIKSRFLVASFDSLYDSLNKIKYNTILTTNVDNLLPKIFANNNNFYLNNVTKTGAVFAEKSAVNYIPLHGNVEDESPNFIFATTELASAFSSDRDKWHYLTNALQTSPTIFWGYRLEDAGVLEALYPQTINKRERKTAWVVLKDNDNATVEYFKALGLNIIVADTASLLNYIGSLSILPKQTKISFATKSLFPEFNIPGPTEVPSRPLIRFYTGEPPIWSDIFSGRIYKTMYYNKIENDILGGHNLIITSLPASGKTTLMMQLAVGVNYDGHKLVCKNMTVEKSDFVLRRLNGDKALIFIDDFANDLNAFNNLVGRQNIRLVGFERDYNYEIVSHKIDKRNCKRIDITILPDKDIQEIFNKIPIEVRTQALSQTGKEEMSPSLFELIQLNTTIPKLKDRFAEVIRQLESSKPILVDILVMLSYVHSCRTPASFDMLMSYLRNTTNDYKEIYQLLQELGQMVVDYGGGAIGIDDNQDYFIPRSTIIAEAVMSQVPSRILRRVINTFHNEISPYRIFRYDIFKMRAYDSGLMAHAFPDWEEGYKFYETAYYIDRSAYLRQQGALYLTKMQRYREAFIWIDEALIQTKHKVFSIRNSHAVILFKANIDKDASGAIVRETLDSSMKILSDCYDADQRKLYHALVFADQAIKYHDKFRDMRSVAYLQTSEKWLSEEEKKGFRRQAIQRLLRSINNILTTAL